MNPRKIAWWAACAATGAAIAALTAAPAKADTGSFLDAVHDLGWYNRATGDVGLLTQGYAVCNALADGYSGPQVARQVYRATDWSVDMDDAAMFVIVAVTNLCPEYDHRGEGFA